MPFTGTPIEWIALIFAALGLIKMIVILVNKKSWWPIAKGVYGNPGVTSVVVLVLAAIVFWFLIQELTIVQIIAAAAFTSLLIAMGFMSYSKELLPVIEKIFKKGFSGGWMWAQIIIWVILLVWVLYVLFV